MDSDAIAIEPETRGSSGERIRTGSTEPIASPDAWIEAMRGGDFASAWRISDAILAARIARGEPPQEVPRHFQSVWTGAPLAGKRVLVRCYHGLGDTIQFIRFAAPLRSLAKEVTVWAQLPLVRLLRTAVGVDRVLPLHDGIPNATFDCDIEIMELAHALRVDARSLPRYVPYLFPRTQKNRLLTCAAACKVGLVWRAGDWDPARSVPVGLLSPLARFSGLQLFSLQCGPAAVEASSIPAQDISSENVDVAAATLRQLDLLISVDTFAAHLAGAIGVPVWLMLRAQCDWRWMDKRRDSVWYPTMRLFRQPRSGDWRSVIAEIARELSDVLRARASSYKDSEQTSASNVRLS